MNIYSIYRARNKFTGIVYIGFTSKTLAQRKTDHKQKALLYEGQTKFYKAIREFGWDAFIWELIYQAKESVDLPYLSHTLKVMEPHFIEEYDSINNGYNSQTGGMYFPVMRGEDHPLYNKGHSDESCKKISDNHHDVSGKNNPMYGRLGKDNPRSIKFWAISPDGIRYEGVGIRDFCKYHNLTRPLVISVMNGSQSHHKGWTFGRLI